MTNKPQFDLSPFEVSAQTMHSFLNSMRRGKELRANILKKYGLLESKEWFPLQDWLDAFHKITERLGEMNLFLTGIAIINIERFPPLHSLKEAYIAVNTTYHLSHRCNGKIMYDATSGKTLDGIGNFQIVSYDEAKREAIIKSDSPYPSKFEEGILYELTKKFKPDPTRAHLIKLDITKERRDKGGRSCTFIINW